MLESGFRPWPVRAHQRTSTPSCSLRSQSLYEWFGPNRYPIHLAPHCVSCSSALEVEHRASGLRLPRRGQDLLAPIVTQPTLSQLEVGALSRPLASLSD